MPSREFNRTKLTQAMDSQGIDCVVATSPWNVTYTSGVYLNIPQVTFLVTTRDGRQALVINEADAFFMRNDSSLSDIRDYRFSDTTAVAAERALDLLAQILGEFDLASGRIGLEEDVMPGGYEAYLAKLLPKALFKPGSWSLNEARIHKLPWEIEVFRDAAYYTDKAIMTGFAQARVGDTERDLATAIQSYVLRSGARTFSHTVCSAGLQSTVVHAHPLDKPIKPGEAIHVDFGGCFDGYSTDLSRTAVVGPPSQRQKDIYQILWDAQQEMFSMIRPGVVARQVYEANQNFFAKAGLRYPWGTIGHSTGLLVHEGFEITATSDRVLEAGMIINIEPTHIEAGDARYHIEDSVLITDRGVEVLSSFYNSNEMFVIR